MAGMWIPLGLVPLDSTEQIERQKRLKYENKLKRRAKLIKWLSYLKSKLQSQ